jgi:signal transduction histidine kinase
MSFTRRQDRNTGVAGGVGATPSASSGRAEAQPPVAAAPSFAEDALAETRARNVLVIAWVHVALRAAIATVQAWAAWTTQDAFYRIGAEVHGAFLLATVAVLVLHRRPWARPHATRALVVLTLLSLAAGGWRVTHSLPVQDTARGVTLLLLAAHLLLLVTSFAGLAIEESLGAYCMRVLRAHRDELTVANLRIHESHAHAERLMQLIVHDLKNPLTAMLTHVSLVREGIEPLPGLTEEREDLRIVQEEGRRLSGMIGDLLLVSRLEEGAVTLQPTSVSVLAVVEPVGRALRAVASARAVRLDVTVPSDLVAPLDPDLFRRVIENLVLNAIRHTGAGDRIEIAASSDGQALRLVVCNTGPGISETERARLFQKDWTGGGGEWRNVGLGLYLCRLVAQAHRGSIALVDRPGWNVAFEIAVPLVEGSPLPETRGSSHLGLREDEVWTCTQDHRDPS